MSDVLKMATLVFIASAAFSQSPDYGSERVAYLQTDHFEKPLHVWLPENYEITKKWPVMCYYHGTGGEPTIEYMRMYTGGKDWVLIGMTYLKTGQFQHSEENLAAERKILDEVLATVSRDVSIDLNRIFVSGFSKGGWVAGLFLQTDTKLAGGMILGAGTFTEGIAQHPKKIYIGIGETDPNLAMSFRALREFSANKATEITHEIWLGIGHRFPLDKIEPSSEPMKQWLRVQAGVADQEEAIVWMEPALTAIQKNEDKTAFEKLELIQRMKASPLAKLLDAEGTDALAEAEAKLLSDPKAQTEQQAKTAFFKVIAYESRDRYVTTLAECAAQYSKIVTAFPDTEYARQSTVAMERISQTLGGATK